MVNAYDTVGGASRSAYRLHQSLLAEGIDSQILVQNKKSSASTIVSTKSKIRKIMINPFRPALDHILMKLYGIKTLFSSSYLPFSEIVKKINQINPDIVHLHWITGGVMTIEDIAKINAPIIWSLHDMWAFTDGYHYDTDFDICKKYYIDKPKNFLSGRVFYRKKKAYSKIDNMTIVGLSRWIHDCAKNSILLKEKRHVNLPNPINTRIFQPFNKIESRNIWNFPQDKKLILFGAIGATGDLRKGFLELNKALLRMTISNVEFVMCGSNNLQDLSDFKFKTHYLGELNDDVCLAKLYSAVDVTIVPSLQENLSNVIMESLACSTPVVGFDIGGNGDMIDHQKNGYLAKPFDIIDLKNGIEWILNNDDFDELCKNAREKILSTFDDTVVVKKYIDLYRGILDDQNKDVSSEVF
jgi:glycosyltransferase involved in cell wall biosynthesis